MSTLNGLDLDDVGALETPGCDTAVLTADDEAAPSRHHAFGNLAVRNGFLSPGELRDCLRHQKTLRRAGISRRPGEIMVERGHLDPEHVDALLTIQQARQTAPAAVPARQSRRTALLCNPRFGRLLLENHLIQREQLRECIGIQKILNSLGYTVRLGEVLLLRGDLSHGAIEALLTIQKARSERCRRRVFQWATAAALVGAILAGAVTRAVAGREDDAAPAGRSARNIPAAAECAALPARPSGLTLGAAPAEAVAPESLPQGGAPCFGFETPDERFGADPEIERRRLAEAEVLRREGLLFPDAALTAVEASDPDEVTDSEEDAGIE